jgi:class 3 adenylate cyclase
LPSQSRFIVSKSGTALRSLPTRISFLDLRGFTRLTQTVSTVTIERLLNTLNALTNRVAREFGGTIRFSVGDSYFFTFTQASPMLAAAEKLWQNWMAANGGEEFGCGMHIALHRGAINAFRSFLYGDGIMAAGRVLRASRETLEADEAARSSPE